jgi:hypothetical protein
MPCAKAVAAQHAISAIASVTILLNIISSTLLKMNSRHRIPSEVRCQPNPTGIIERLYHGSEGKSQ